MLALIEQGMLTGLKLGLDIGSTTAKAVITDSRDRVLFSEYNRHNGRIKSTVNTIINKALQKFSGQEMSLAITGSAGMGLSEKSGIPFVQELIASAEFVTTRHPEARTLIDIGGEDSKIIFLNSNGSHDLRMNGSCAGGTGAFIDQIATLLKMPVSKLNSLADKSEKSISDCIKMRSVCKNRCSEPAKPKDFTA